MVDRNDYDNNNRDDGPRFKDMCREAPGSGPTEPQQPPTRPHNKAAGNNNNGGNNTNEIQVPLAYAVAVDGTMTTNNTNSTDQAPSAAPTSTTASRQDNNYDTSQNQNQNSANSDAMVLTVSQKTLYWVLAIVVLLVGAAVAGVLASRGRGDNGTDKLPTPVAGDNAIVTTPATCGRRYLQPVRRPRVLLRDRHQ
jgi:hypothetical protein